MQFLLDPTVVFAVRVERLEAELEKLMSRMASLEHAGGPADFPVKAAFVTYNTEDAAETCLEAMPRGERRMMEVWVMGLCTVQSP
jgi:hypothetical protein